MTTGKNKLAETTSWKLCSIIVSSNDCEINREWVISLV